MDIDKIKCIATIFIYITPITAILSYIDYRLIKEMVRDGEDNYYWTIDSDTNVNDNLF